MGLTNLNYIFNEIVKDCNKFYKANVLNFIRDEDEYDCDFIISFPNCNSIVINDFIDLVSLSKGKERRYDCVYDDEVNTSIELKLHQVYPVIPEREADETLIYCFYDNDMETSYTDSLSFNDLNLDWSVDVVGAGDTVLTELEIYRYDNVIFLKLVKNNAEVNVKVFKYPLSFQTSLKVEE